ncbi:hypothetical protein ABIC03_007075 [Bradyrhizobium sp. RT6a]|uniref:hypothetical protein n=1 Tax=Bradyrhizobium sp. RT6a TaxID=3156381 RepID=UPI0033965152
MHSIANNASERLAVSQAEAARILGVNRRKIAAAVRSGALTIRRVPDGIASRIALADLLDWFGSWERKPTGRPRKKENTNAS